MRICSLLAVCFLMSGGNLVAEPFAELLEILRRRGSITEAEYQDLSRSANRAKLSSDRESGQRVDLFWNHGLKFESEKRGVFEGALSGRIEIDTAVFSNDGETESVPGIGNLSSGAEFRRIRLAIGGRFGDAIPVLYKTDLGFGGAALAVKDLYLGLANVPVLGTLRFGHLKEPTTLEGTMSSRFLSFMERGLPVSAFWPERNTGVSAQRAVLDDRATWHLAAFTDTVLQDGVENGTPLDGDLRLSGRFTGLPWYDTDGGRQDLVHVGLSGTSVHPEGDRVRFQSQPESGLAPDFLDTGVFAADQNHILGTELAWQRGPFSLQAEWIGNWVEQKGGPTSQFGGYYISGAWILTGEQRAYHPKTGVFGRVTPRSDFGFGAGPGAWELALRYSHLDLNDAGILGGELDNLTGGLNWYLNPSTRFQFNYIYAMLEREVAGAPRNGSAHIFQTRWHVHF